MTLLILWLVVTGRVSFSPVHPLESLPDIKPLGPNEYQPIPSDVELPEGHVLKLGESTRFGDVIVTPVRVTNQPTEFINILTNKPDTRKWPHSRHGDCG